uniref:Non-structural protein 3b n=1 Tax=Bird gammacoronavirus AnasCN24 TaxID=3237959 RepID=A0AB39AEU1_9GAMC
MAPLIETGFKTVAIAASLSITIEGLLSTSYDSSQYQKILIERGEDAISDASRIAHLISIMSDILVFDPFAEAFYRSGSFWEIDSMEEDGSILTSESDIELY